MKAIKLKGVRQNNIQNIDVEIPLYKINVICGPSGSGKSSLAFDTLFAEGQRRFIESLSHYAKQFIQKASKPELDSVTLIPPAIALKQHNGVKSSRSYVGSLTEIADYLRLLFDKAAKPYCPHHHLECEKLTSGQATEKLFKKALGARGYLLVPLSDQTLLPAKQLHGSLLQKGYLRVLVQNKKKWEVFQLSDPAFIKKGLKLEGSYLVIDRFEVNLEDQGRIADSMEQGYRLSSWIFGPHHPCGVVFYDTEGSWFSFSDELSCPECEFQPVAKSFGLFNSNSPLGACSHCKGFGNTLELDPHKVIPDGLKSIEDGALHPFSIPSAEAENQELLKFCREQKIPTDIPWIQLSSEHQKKVWRGDKTFIGVEGLFRYLDQIKYKMHVRVFISRYRSSYTCSHCEGFRLKSEAYVYKVCGQDWKFFLKTPLEDLKAWFERVQDQWSLAEKQILKEVLIQIQSRLSYLIEVGLPYLTLSRETRTLSGGEYQRIMLSNQLGMELSQTLYVLDEPTIGLHPRDNSRLLRIMKKLRDLGNTLVIVEHDEDVILQSDYVLEMGPGSGALGGQLLFAGSKEDFLKSSDSLTASYLRPSAYRVPFIKRGVDLEQHKYKLTLTGVRAHNLKNIDVTIPLNRFVVVEGVSGSGKSTLVRRVLYPLLANYFKEDFQRPLEYGTVQGLEFLKGVVLLDQSPLSRNSRSMPVTYLKVFDRIRDQFASDPMAKFFGYSAGFFSLNVEGGRCPVCKGVGYQEIDLVFMDHVVLPCEECEGRRYKPEMQKIKLHGLNIVEVLNLTVDEAAQFFSLDASLRKVFHLLKEVGLGYLKLGQNTETLSGGEAQRLKIVRELLESQQKQSIFILDEPTTGLHFREVDMLILVLQKLVDSGGTVLVIEHNSRVIQAADWVVELGPEGGDRGGQIVYQGPR
jgi:excinuclease ABC subunit A